MSFLTGPCSRGLNSETIGAIWEKFLISLGRDRTIFRWFLRRLWPVIVEMTIQFGQKSAETLRCSDAELFKDHAGAGLL